MGPLNFHQVCSLREAVSEHMNSIPVKGSQAMGCTKENKIYVFQLLMDTQSAGPKAGAGVKQNLTETKSVLNLHCEHQDYPTYSFDTLTMLQGFREGHGIMNL